MRYVYLNGRWNKPLEISSSFKELPLSAVEGYDLEKIDSFAVEGLAYHCPKLNRLEIGGNCWVIVVASSYTNADDSCCEMIAD